MALPGGAVVYVQCYQSDGGYLEEMLPFQGSDEATLAFLESRYPAANIIYGEPEPAAGAPASEDWGDEEDDWADAAEETAGPGIGDLLEEPAEVPSRGLGSGEADAIETEESDFDTGRIANHAPEQMVLGQPYLLELAIQPITKSTDIAELDIELEETIGTGLAPGAEGPAPTVSFDTVRASEVMKASLTAPGFEVVGTTDEEQLLMAGETTVWQWQVTPTSPTASLINYKLSEIVTVNGRDRSRTVKTLPVSVKVLTLDELLAPADDPINLADARTAQPLAESLTADSAPSLTPVAAGTCTTEVGTDPSRHALVLNNLTYQMPISTLSETRDDGERVAKALKETGFTVTRCEDLSRKQTISALSQLGRTNQAIKADGNEAVAFFYYSGHGANVDGINYILPSDQEGATPENIRDGGVSFEDIFNRVTPVSTTSFVVFDACRTVADDQSRGLVRSYSPVSWATGVLQAFATSPGKTAADSGVYSNALSETITTLPDPANVVFKRVQDRVAQLTDSKQVPVYTDATTGGDFYFINNAQ